MWECCGCCLCKCAAAYGDRSVLQVLWEVKGAGWLWVQDRISVKALQ